MSVKMHRILNFPDAKAKEVHEWLKQALDRDADPSDTGFDNPDDWDGRD